MKTGVPSLLEAQSQAKRGKDPCSYMHGCLEHLHYGASCLGSLLNSQSPNTDGESMIPTTAELLKLMYPGKCARDFLPFSTIVYMGPGGRRQWPMSIVDRFSFLAHTTRKSAIEHLAKAAKAFPDWRPKHHSKGTHKLAIVAPPPIKFLDMGTRMGLYEVEGLIPDIKNTSNVLHPRTWSGSPVPGTFYEVMRENLGKPWVGDTLWCDEKAWVNHSKNYGFHARDPLGYLWVLPTIVPTSPRKLFGLGLRKKYVDIVADTLHASSSDLITWNTLAMIRTELKGHISKTWLEIATAPLPAGGEGPPRSFPAWH